jgi:hypothetical protein
MNFSAVLRKSEYHFMVSGHSRIRTASALIVHPGSLKEVTGPC